MGSIFNFLSNGIVAGSLYLLVAIGFSLIYDVAGDLNFAHGGAILIGGISVFTMTNIYSYNIWMGIFVAIVAGCFLNLFIFKAFVQPVEDRIVAAILTLVFFLLLEQIAYGFLGSNQAIPDILPGTLSISGYAISYNRLGIVILSLVIFGVLVVAINATKQGRAIRAVSMGKKGAVLVGIEPWKISLYTWVISGGLAAIAGAFLGSITTVYPTMGLQPMILSFAIVVVGGIGSVKGTLIGAYVIGFLEVFTSMFINANLSIITPLIVLLVVIVMKPEGLFGRPDVNH